MTILVVDDEESIVEVVGEYLRARGLEVRTASDGDQALAIAREGRVEVVISDLRMPVRGGMSLLEGIREAHLPIAAIVMTGFGTVETALQAMKLGAVDYLLKPVRLRDLHAAVGRAREVGRKRLLAARHEDERALFALLLGLGPPVDRSNLGAPLGRVLAWSCGGPVGVDLVDGPSVERLAEGPQLGRRALTVGTGPALRAWLPADLDPETDDQVRRLVERSLRALVEAEAAAPGP